jgi:DNA polymerase-3 subunit epsilon
MPTKLEDAKFVCIDCETTGLDFEHDRIIEVGVIVFDLDKYYRTFETLVNPERSIPDESQAIHHITTKMVLDKPLIKEVLPTVLEIIGKHIIVGHGVNFDITMLANSARRASIPTTITKNPFMDTLRLARSYGESPINSHEELRKHFHIDAEVAHRAMGDVIVNIEVFKRLIYRYKTVEDIFRVLSRPVLLREMPLGKHKGRPFKEIPENYLLWAVNKDFDQDLIYSLRTELKRRKSGGLFSQSSNPFQEL